MTNDEWGSFFRHSAFVVHHFPPLFSATAQFVSYSSNGGDCPEHSSQLSYHGKTHSSHHTWRIADSRESAAPVIDPIATLSGGNEIRAAHMVM
jgi:hypothetical protein